MIHRINLKSLEDNIDHVEKNMKLFKTIEHLEQTLWEKTTLARTKLRSLIPHRTKRGLINALGTAIKFITGNPDNNDLEIMQESLGILKTQENKLVNNQMKQIKINTLFESKINNITDSIRKISLKISKEYNTVQGLRSDLEFVNLIWNTDKIIHILEDIEEQIELARVGLINKNILSLEEKLEISEKLKKQKLNLNYLDEIFQYTSASIGISGNQAALLVKTPILDSRTYDLLGLHTLRINESRIDTYINMVTKHGNVVYYQPTECDICDNDYPIEDECIYKILTQQKPTCPLIKSKQTTQIKEIKQGIILIDTTETMEVKDSCGNSRMVNDATIIETENCTIKVRNFTFHGQPDETHQDEYLIPIYSKPLPEGNLTIPDDESLILRIQNLEELSEVQLSSHNTHQWVTIGGSTLLILTFVCFFSIYLYKKARKRKDATKITPQFLTATGIEDVEYNGGITPIESKPEKIEPKFFSWTVRPKTSNEDA